MESINTQLRYVSSKKIERIIEYVNRLQYKIEIKGGISFDGKFYYLSFIIPNDIMKEIPSGNIDKIGARL